MKIIDKKDSSSSFNTKRHIAQGSTVLIIIAASILSISAILFSSCATVPGKRTLPLGWISDPSSSDLIYTPLNLPFPEKINNLTRIDPMIYDQKGLDTSIGYFHDKLPFYLTLYIYLRSYYKPSDPEGHFEDCINSMKKLNPNIVITSKEVMDFKLGVTETTGYLALGRFRDQKGEWGSYLIILPYGDKFVKVRETFFLGPTDEALLRAKDTCLSAIKELLMNLNFPAP